MKIIRTILSVSILFICLLCSTAFSGNDSDDGNWQVMIEPYILFSSINGDAKIGRTSGIDVDVDFDDILETLEIGYMGHLEIFYKDNWGLMLDYAYMSLSDDLSLPLGGIISGKAQQSVFEAFFIKRFHIEPGKVDVFTGIRKWDNEIEVNVQPAVWPGTASIDIDESWIDAAIGARCFIPVHDRWTIMFRGDIGGFGLESDFTATLDARIMFDITKSIILDVGYKALWVDYESGTTDTKGHFVYDTVTHGPLIGVIFKF
jgi:hypothetical protein